MDKLISLRNDISCTLEVHGWDLFVCMCSIGGMSEMTAGYFSLTFKYNNKQKSYCRINTCQHLDTELQ